MASLRKPDRIEKELLLLRNLPNTFKIGKKNTALGTVVYVNSILTSLVARN